MAGGVCAHHSVIYVLHFTVCSEKDAFEEGEQEIVIGTVYARSEPRRCTGFSIVVHISAHFHNSHVLHTPPLYFSVYTKSPNACCDVSVCLCIKEHQCHYNLVPTNE